MKKISTRFALMMAVAAIVPLLAYGAVSIISTRDGARRAVIQGNEDVARRVGAQIEQYVISHVRILKAIAAEIQQTELAQWQQERILRNLREPFPEFTELTLIDDKGKQVASSRLDLRDTPLPGPGSVQLRDATISRFSLDEDLLPTATAAVEISRGGRNDGWLIGKLKLEQLWRTVDGISIGRTGHALIVTDDGQLLAHGEKSVVARRESQSAHPVLQEMIKGRATKDSVVTAQYVVEGEELLGVGVAVHELPWMVIVEQPTSEAFAIPASLQQLLIISIGVALFAMLFVGVLWGRRFIDPILRLTRGTRELAQGKLDTRVVVTSSDELGQLGKAFNTMADRLVELQEDVRKKERHAMFGRIAIGLVHDLSHPIQNVGNSSKLMLQMWDDPQYRETFRRTLERELSLVRRVLDDLRNIAKPTPVERFPIDVNKCVADMVDSMAPTADNAGLTMTMELAPEAVYMEGDLFALNRVTRNLISNAIQATSPRGRIVVRTLAQDNRAVIEVADTGCGIPAERQESIFDDFVTTKRRGLGLGLAISKKVVEQMGGTIAVTSQVGVGSAFTIRFPLTASRPSKAAAG